MIRKLAIILALFAATVMMCVYFYKHGLAYEPLQLMRLTEESPEDRPEDKSDITSGWSDAIAGNNLFDPYRAEPPKPSEISVSPSAPAPAPVEEKVPPRVELNGIIFNQYGELVAYVVINGAPPKALRKGDTFEGLSVLNITEKNVEMKWEEIPISLTLEKIRNIRPKKDNINEVTTQ